MTVLEQGIGVAEAAGQGAGQAGALAGALAEALGAGIRQQKAHGLWA